MAAAKAALAIANPLGAFGDILGHIPPPSRAVSPSPGFGLPEGRPALIPGASGADQRWMVPDIIEFTTSDQYLNKPSLYPRQATLLKVIFLQTELFTDYDYEVLEEWSLGFKLPDGVSASGQVEDVTTKHYTGEWGINPDIMQRIQWLKDHGHPWFSIVLAVQGRRSGKGHIGAICAAYVLWHYICASDPKSIYGIDPAKRIACQVFAGKKAQARDNQWRDIANTILDAPCFDSFLGTPLVESLTVQTPVDAVRRKTLEDRNISTAMDLSTFEFVPKEATTMAARGPASFMQFYDEMAHMVNTGVSKSAADVWNSATPALDQFKKDAFIYCGSSPWTMMGKFYDLVQESLEVDAVSLEAINPTILTIQLASWDIYVDWEKTVDGDFLLAPERPAKTPTGLSETEMLPPIYASRLKGAIQEYDDKMRREERLNPVTFGVERRAKWATAMDSYFDPMHIDRCFMDWNGIEMMQLDAGQPAIHDYYAHADPGKTSSNFGFSVAHLVPDPDGDPIPHVVFDRVHGFTPGDFPVGEGHNIKYEMDYMAIEEQIKRWYDGFLFTDLSFDQWNSISFVQRLQQYGRSISYKPTHVWERTTTAPLNWAAAETMKVALSLNRVHMPYNELAELEMKFLRKLPGDKVDHPDSGPVTTKDVYDTISIVIHKLLGAQISAIYGEQFMALRMEGGMPGQVAASTPGHPSSPGAGGTSKPLSNPSVQQMFRRDVTPAQRRSGRGGRNR